MLRLGLFTFLLALSSPQLSVANTNVESIQKIVFSAHRFDQAINQTSQSVQIITQKEIQSINASSLEDVFKTAIGVDFLSYGAPAEDTDIKIRGSDHDEVIVMLDGTRINDLIQSRANLLNSIPVQIIKRIEIIRGSASVLYGSDANAGLINIITKNDHDDTESNFQFQTGNLGLFKESISHLAKIKNHSITANYTRHDQKGRFKNDRYQGNFLFLSDRWIFSDLGELQSSLTFLNHTQELALDPSVFDITNFPTSIDSFIWPDTNRSLERNIVIPQVTLKLNPVKTHDIQMSYSLYYEDQRLENSNQGDTAPPGAAQLSSQLFNSKGYRHTFDLTDHLTIIDKKDVKADLTFGGSSQLEFLKTSNASYPGDAPVIPVANFPDESIGQKGSRRNFAGYSEANLTLLKRIGVSVGVRHDYNNTYGQATSYRVSTHYNAPVINTKFYSTVSRGFKAPTINQYYIALTDTTGFQISQRTSKETSTTFEVGARYTSNKNLFFDASYFYTHYDDLIDFIQYIDEAHIHGFNTSASYSPWSFLKLSSHYQFLHAINDANGSQLSNRPRHQFYFSANVTPVKNLSFNLESITATQRQNPLVLSTNSFGDINLNYFYSNGLNAGTNSAGYTVLNLSTNYTQKLKSKTLKEINYNLRLNNILNKAYEQTLGFPHSRFTLIAGIEIKH